LINAVRVILVILFGIYQIWAYKNSKPIIMKLFPMILLPCVGLLIIALAPLFGHIGFYFIFLILTVELSLLGAMLVVVIEIFIALIGSSRNITKVLKLVSLFILLLVVYLLGERVF